MITGTYDILPDAAGRITQSAILRLDCDTSSAPVIINLPPIADLKTYRNVRIVVFDGAKNASVNNITINGAGDESLGSDGVEVIATDAGGVTIGVASPTEWITTNSSEMTGAGSGSEWYSTNDIPMGDFIDYNPLQEQVYTPTKILTTQFEISSEAGGKSVVFSDLTHVQAGGVGVGLTGISNTVAEILPKLEEVNIQEMEITEQSAAGDVTLPALKKIIGGGVIIAYHPTAEAITLPSLEEMQIGELDGDKIAAIGIGASPLVTSVSAEKLSLVRNLSPEVGVAILSIEEMPLLNSLSILERLLTKVETPDPNTFLVGIGGALPAITNEEMQRFLTAISPSMDLSKGFYIYDMVGATSLVFSGVKVFTINLVSCPNLISFDMSTVTESESYILGLLGSGGVIIGGCTSLESLIVAPALACTLFNAQNCALPTANIDSILASLRAGGLPNGNAVLDGGTNGIPTGGAYNTDLIALQSDGWSIAVNS